MRFRRQLFILIALILLAAFILRISFLTADPFPYTEYEATWFDEMAFAHNSRNLVLFNTLSIENDLWNPVYFTPTHTIFTFISFNLFGVNTLSMRLVPVFLGFLSTLILSFLLYKKNKTEGIILLAILSISPMLIAYSRISIAESSLLFFISIILGLMIQGKRISWFFIGILTPILFFAKISSAFFVAAIPLSLFLHRIFYNSQISFQRLKIFLLGFALSFTASLFWLVPNFSSWIFMNFGNHGERIGIEFKGLVVALITFLKFIALNPLIFVIMMFILISIFMKIKKKIPLDYSNTFLVTLIVLFLVQIILVDYSLRRFVLLLPVFLFYVSRYICNISSLNVKLNDNLTEISKDKIIIIFLIIYSIISLSQLAPLYFNIAKDIENSHVLIRNSVEIAGIIPEGEKVYGKHALALSIENKVIPYFGEYLNSLGNIDSHAILLLENKEINYAILKLNIFNDKDIKEYDRDIKASKVYTHLYENFEVIEEIESIHTRTNEPDIIYIYKRKNLI